MGFDPITMAVASGVGSVVAQAQSSSAQRKAQAAHNQRVNEAAIENYQKLGDAEQDVLYNTQQDALEAKVKGLEAKANQEAAASATGIRGVSQNVVLNQMERDYETNLNDVRMAREQYLADIRNQAAGIYDNALASHDHRPTQGVNLLQAATTGLSVYSGMGG